MESKSTSKKIKTSSSSPDDLFSLLPYELTLDCLARISIIYNPILSLVSKNFKTIISSRDLHETRSRIRKPEDRSLYVCLNPNKKDPNPRWFALSTSIPKQQKLIPIPSFPHQKLLSGSSVVATGSEIYIIGGCLNKEGSKKVLLLDCRSHQWLRLPNMLHARSHPAVAVVNGKIHVFGGGTGSLGWGDGWGEVYDPKTKKWKLDPDRTRKPSSSSKTCLVELGNVLCGIYISLGKLYCHDTNKRLTLKVLGLNQFSPNKFSSVVKSTTRGRVAVWWKTEKGDIHSNDCKTEIWCAEISFERPTVQELRGFVEWSKIVFTFEGCDSNSDFFLNSAIVTH